MLEESNDKPTAGSVAKLVNRLSKDIGAAKTNEVIFRRGNSPSSNGPTLGGMKQQQRVVRARFSYTPAHRDELELKVDDLIEVMGESEEGWLKGKLNGKTGVFPSNYVGPASASDSSAARFPPPKPPPKHTDAAIDDTHRSTVGSALSERNEGAGDGISQRQPSVGGSGNTSMEDEIQPKKVKGIGFGVDILGQGVVKLRSTKALSQETVLTPPVATAAADNDTARTTIDFRHRDTAGSRSKSVVDPTTLDATTTTPALAMSKSPDVENNNHANVNSGGVTAMVRNQQQHSSTATNNGVPKSESNDNTSTKRLVRVLYSWEPNHEDELPLSVGDIITVVSKESEDSGWWRGELPNGRRGVFPDNFVEIIPPTAVVKASSPTVVGNQTQKQPPSVPNKPPPAPVSSATTTALPSSSSTMTTTTTRTSSHGRIPTIATSAAANSHSKPSVIKPLGVVTSSSTSSVPPLTTTNANRVSPTRPASKDDSDKPLVSPPERPKKPNVLTKLFGDKEPPIPAMKSSPTNEEPNRGMQSSESSERLKHLTTDRPKQAKRPPSTVFIQQKLTTDADEATSPVKETAKASPPPSVVTTDRSISSSAKLPPKSHFAPPPPTVQHTAAVDSVTTEKPSGGETTGDWVSRAEFDAYKEAMHERLKDFERRLMMITEKLN